LRAVGVGRDDAQVTPSCSSASRQDVRRSCRGPELRHLLPMRNMGSSWALVPMAARSTIFLQRQAVGCAGEIVASLRA
jgi:hypothetical protein